MPSLTDKQKDILTEKITPKLFRYDLWNKIGFKPHPKQIEIFDRFDSGARFIDIVAGTRSGKTILGSAWMLEGAVVHKPDNVPMGILPIIAPYGRLTDKAFRWLWQWIVIEKCLGYEPRKKSEHERYIEMPWGMRFEGLTADNPANVKGEGWVRVLIDEFAEIRADFYSKYIERGLMDCLAPVMRITTPLGQSNHTNHDWHDTEAQMIAGDKNYFATRFTSYDNPHLPDGEVARIEEKYRRQGLLALFEQEYLGMFTALQGAIYATFEETKDGDNWHVDDVDPLPDVPFEIGVDWGTDHPAVAIFTQVFGDRINVIDMIYQTGLSDSEFAQLVVDKADWWSDVNGIEVVGRSGKRRNVKMCYCDPSDPGGKKEFRNAGLPVYEQPRGVEANLNDRMYAPRMLVKMFSRGDKPAVRIDRTRCKPLIFQLHNMIYDTNEKPKKQNRLQQAGDAENFTGDDAHDAFRYVVGGAIGQARTSRVLVGIM